MTGAIKKSGLIILGFFIAALFFEIILRILGFPASSIYGIDQETGLLIFRPDSEIYIRSSCFSNIIKTNSLGFHSKEYNLEKPKGVFRIAVIGDSFIEASQVPIERTFVYLLEKKLNDQSDRKYRYEVIPFGISSHGTYKSLLYLKAYALKFEPDLVIVVYSLNDLEDDAGEAVQFNEEGKPVLEIKPVGPKPIFQKINDFFKSNLRKSVLVTTLRKEILSLKARFAKKTINTPLSDNPETLAKAWDNEKKFLASFNEISKADDSGFLLMSLADARIYSDSVQNLNEAEKLRSIAENNSFHYFDLMPAFKEKLNRENQDFTWPCDGHWNEAGNEWAAEALFKYLNENLLSDK